jgi:hypothetical protein
VLGRRDLKPLHALRERGLVVRLDEQVHVRALDAEVHDPEARAPGRRQRRLADRLVHAAPTEIPDRAHHAEHDVDRVPPVQERPLLVRRPGTRPLRRPTGASPLAAALLEQHQLGLLQSSPAAGRLLAQLHVAHNTSNVAAVY